MKKFLVLTVTVMTLAMIAASCGSSHGHCDAYSSVDQPVENGDLASR